MARKAIILSTLPLLILTAYIALLGLDIPFHDQWATVPLFEKVKHGSASLADFFSQHNEHRPFFPRLLWLTLSQWTGYNLNAELWLDLGIALITFGVFVSYTAWVWRQHGVKTLDSFLPLFALLVFNLAQWEGWLTGFQATVFLGMMAIVTGFIVLCRFNTWLGLLGAAFLGGIATFSIANAVLYWLIGLLLIALLSDPTTRWLRFTAWAIISTFMWIAFFRGWTPTPMASWSVLWRHPWVYIIWVLNFIGAPMMTYWYAWAFGILSLIWLAMVGLRAYKICGLRLLAPHGAIIVFVLASALAIGVGRSSISLSSSLASRYLTQTVWYWASLLALLPLSQLRNEWQRLVKLLMVVMLCACTVGGGVLGYYSRYLRTLPAYRAVKRGEDVSDRDLERITGMSRTIGLERLEILRRNNWSVYRK